MAAPTTQPQCTHHQLFGFGWPYIMTGKGVPTSATAPDGTLYLRADAPDSSNALYVSVGGVWTAK